MPRRSREEGRNAVHHVFAHAAMDAVLFVDDVDREKYLELLAKVAVAFGWRCMGYCLMGNHVHLLVETPEPNLGAGMQRLHGEYARHFNQRHGARGHRFQGRYGNRRVTDDRQFYAVVRYIAHNPAEAGLCRAADDWHWSSHRGVLRDATPTWFDRARLLSLFAAGGGDGLVRYRRLIAGKTA